jgi:membrane protein DedA with SNARE-associated domain
VEHILATWGYLALFVIVAVSAAGPPVGSEVATGYAGALASGQLTTSRDHLGLGWVILVAVLGELVGSIAGYSIGRLGGRPLVDRAGRYMLLTHRDLDRAEAWFTRRGEPFVLFGRLIPLLRSFVSLAAGLGEMTFAKFMAYTVIGAAAYDAMLAGIGYSLGASWHNVIKDFSDAGYVIAVLLAVAIVAALTHRLSVLRAERAGRTRPGLRARAQAAAQRLPEWLERPLAAWHVDWDPPGRQPRAAAVGAATAISVAGSLAADAILVKIAETVFPSTDGYGHFQFADYAKLTVIGVVIACLAWPITTRISSAPRWIFFRMAIVVTLVLWCPDLWILFYDGEPVKAVAVLMLMHLAIALITYNALVRLAPAGSRAAGPPPAPAARSAGPLAARGDAESPARGPHLGGWPARSATDATVPIPRTPEVLPPGRRLQRPVTASRPGQTDRLRYLDHVCAGCDTRHLCCLVDGAYLCRSCQERLQAQG